MPCKDGLRRVRRTEDEPVGREFSMEDCLSPNEQTTKSPYANNAKMVVAFALLTC